ncbi:TAXI family TRAP transporter solute-binding subunit [Rhodopseudomonas sp. B29]|uniref:TAXI family TRAP transporter solute-binding subunit n=1 Tax=Rhodopseudomonas sp. B29 TaxID=95607 RepID=UPI0006846D89|nr:TAXI family TRAP transporter solute-binding subunit [Rhodopseudomonas sp. B29]
MTASHGNHSQLTSESLRKRRLRNRRIFNLAVVITIITLAVGSIGVIFYELRPVTLKIAVGPAGSDDLKLVQLLSQAFARNRSQIRLQPVVTEGANPSIEALRQNKADLAVVRADLDLPADAQSVVTLRKNFVVMWSVRGRGRKSGAIKNISDLPGHTVGVIGRTPANVKMLQVILSESGVSPDKVKIQQFQTTQIAEMARDESLDAYLALGPLDSKITIEAIAATAKARGEPRFLPIDVGDAIAKKFPIYDSEEIPGSIFSTSPPRPEDKVDTISVSHLIVAKQSLSSLTVTRLTRQIFAVRQQIAREMPIAGKIEAPDTDKDAAIPAHRGAAAFIDGTDRTFMERNSDYIWGLILLLSGLGSAGAWLRSYLTRDEREIGGKMRDRALGMIGKARKADSVAELDAMQHDIDRILRETLDFYDDGAIDDLEPFGLVLDQFQRAAADRRSALIASAGSDLEPPQNETPERDPPEPLRIAGT